AALLAAVALAQCGDDEVSAAGIWALRTVEGADLPAVVEVLGNTVTSVDRQLFLVRADGSCLL
ncbi:MAG: hypothetical protein GWN07_19095, partial [Actinobacteria bacterium]|nr:hypothetical protein [Actinomycetota bacterium]NIS32538.1 hypothetical protein [Actinomycetota bacterium]NIU67556.1 hypothetical protein [Actinomycetota bacterium]NIW29316.1 hypothetical protein [Actinomycetota bacterium]NIX21826.1 hypothetical protein [Actinomycetota bacterium]